ncbi:inner membrane complex suture component, putative [Hepatocystis sp. ex Piliocolobus tephrosceles]|nr:inner membrane complex suture component, putative [Hepatocystis sp. ex Piliocolobus tephrosceles]
MNFINSDTKGEYEALISGSEVDDNKCINNNDENSNNLTKKEKSNSDNIDNVNDMNKNENLNIVGSPLTYVADSDGEYMENINYENIENMRRVETDIKYYKFFIIYALSLFVIICYYFYYGNYYRILYGINYNGKICGKDLKKYPYLYFPISPKNTKNEILHDYMKCLESCPTINEYDEKATEEEHNLHKNEENNIIDMKPVSGEENNKKNKKEGFFKSLFHFNKTKKNVILDKHGNETTNIVYSDYTKNKDNNLYVEYSLNSPFYDTTNIMNICYPKDKTLRHKVINTIFTNRYKTFVNLFSFHNSFFLILVFVFFIIILSFTYLFFLYFFSVGTFYFFFVCYFFSIVLIPLYFIHKHLYLIFNPIKGSLFSYHYGVSILICFIILIHGVISLFILYIYKNTYKYTSRLISVILNFVNEMPNVLYAPLTITILSFAWFAIWVCTYIHIMTAGTVEEKRITFDMDTNGNSQVVSLQKVFHYFQSSYLFSFLWICVYFFICEILQSLNQFSISYLGTVWYFSDKNKLNYNLNTGMAMKTIINYHMGSLVLSSFITLCTKHLRILFFWTNSTLSLPFFFNDIIYNVKKKFRFILAPISRLIDMYTTSSFCEITYVLDIIFPCFTTLIMTFFSFNIFNNFQRYSDVHSSHFIPNPFFAALTIGVLCGLITSYFITVISTLSDTVLYCFVCECYQKQIIDEDPLQKTYTPSLLKELILELYEEHNAKI